MKFSIITPTHDLKYINELAESILAQTFKDFEWIIMLNNKAIEQYESKQYTIPSDPRFKIIKSTSNSTVIGAIKKKAFNLGAGDYLVEVDHDDVLHERCLEKLLIEFETDPSVGFVYSDDAVINQSKNFVPYNKSCGWVFDLVDFKGQKSFWMKSFSPDAASFSIIYYQPDHVRAWRASVYHQIGGHDEKLDILDDQDLISRTYINTNVVHIPQVLYYYRYYEGNTYKTKSDKISTLSEQLRSKYMRSLVEKECKIRELPMYDLGGGINPYPGYKSVDLHNGDITCDLNEDWKIESNSVGLINASHIFEHLRNPLHTMSELYRVLADGGYAYIEVPSTDGRGAFQDPTHVSFWNINSFKYYCNKSHHIYTTQYGYGHIKFQCLTIRDESWGDGIIVTKAWLRAIKSNKRTSGYKELSYDGKD